MEQVEEICDHIILVNKGKKILDGTVSDIRQQFKENLFTVGSAQTLSNVPPTNLFTVIKETDKSITLKIAPGAQSNNVIRYFMDQQVEINQFTEVLPSLNDIFIKLVDGTTAARQFTNVQ